MDNEPDSVTIARALAAAHLNPTDAMKLSAIVAAYDRAMLDAKTVIPTYLHAAIEAARKLA